MGALETATLIDISPLVFWELTPFELSLMVKAFRKKIERESEEKLTLTYMNALWTAQWFSKKQPPKLKDILKKTKAKKVMSPEKMLEKVKQINAMLGGEIKHGP